MKVLLAIDNGSSGSTSTAFSLCMETIDRDQDELYLINVYTSWDYLNEEKNAGRLALSLYERLCKAEGIKCIVRQFEADNPNAEFVEIIKQLGIEKVFIGSQSYSKTANDDNFIFSLFSNVKRYFMGTTADYLISNCEGCEIIVAGGNSEKEADILEEDQTSLKFLKFQ